MEKCFRMSKTNFGVRYQKYFFIIKNYVFFLLFRSCERNFRLRDEFKNLNENERDSG